MRVSQPKSYWDTLMSHVKTSNAKPPWAVIYAVAALLGDDEIKGSWMVYKPEEPDGHTTWAVFIVAANGLVHAELRFDAVRHALNESINHPAASTIMAAWVRRLRDITSISIGTAQTEPPRNAPPEWFGVGDISIGFADGTQVEVPFDQRVMSEEDRSRSDDFLAAIRTGAGL
jgi:hypothetical protein